MKQLKTTSSRKRESARTYRLRALRYGFIVGEPQRAPRSNYIFIRKPRIIVRPHRATILKAFDEAFPYDKLIEALVEEHNFSIKQAYAALEGQGVFIPRYITPSSDTIEA